MQTVTLQATPTQSIKSVLGGQNCSISLSQKDQGLFVSIEVDAVPIVTAVIARDAVPLICRDYVGFSGNLLFVDTQGADDPLSAGLGSRWQLVYLTVDEYALI